MADIEDFEISFGELSNIVRILIDEAIEENVKDLVDYDMTVSEFVDYLDSLKDEIIVLAVKKWSEE